MDAGHLLSSEENMNFQSTGTPLKVNKYRFPCQIRWHISSHGKEAPTLSRIWSSLSKITGSTCSRDNIQAERCCCSRFSILDCKAVVRTKTPMHIPTLSRENAIQIVTEEKCLQLSHLNFSEGVFCSFVLVFAATFHFCSVSIVDLK